MIGTLTVDEIARYRRHLSLAGFGPAGQERLKKATVLVIGAGGLGCPALLYLAAAGVGRMVIVDDDRVEVSNLQRQVLYTEADIGEFKAAAAARRLRALNAQIAVEPRAERFSRGNALALVGDCDVVVDGSDNFSTRYLVNDACVLANKPLVYGAIQGFEGQLSVFNWRGGPTYRCLFPEPPAPGTVPNCAEGGVLGVLPGLIGTAQACEAIKLLAGIGEPLSGRLLLWDALAMTTQTVTLAPDPRSRDISELPPEGYGEICETGRSGSLAPSVAKAAADLASPAKSQSGRALFSSAALEIDGPELQEALVSAPKLQLIDVREDWERALGAIEPSIHIPLGALNKGAAGAELAQLNPEAPTVVYCAVGVRSLYGVRVLRERHGFSAAVSLRGGYNAWHGENQ